MVLECAGAAGGAENQMLISRESSINESFHLRLDLHPFRKNC